MIYLSTAHRPGFVEYRHGFAEHRHDYV